MSIITDCIKLDKEYRQLVSAVSAQNKAKPLPIFCSGICGGAATAFLVSLIKDNKEKNGTGTVIFAGDEKDAAKLAGTLCAFNLTAMTYTSRDFNFYNIIASHEYEHERLKVLSAILEKNYDAVITTPDAALQFTIPVEKLEKSLRKISSSDLCNLSELSEFLVSSGYVRVDMISGIGQFSIRGGIIDIYPPYAKYTLADGTAQSGSSPIRIELFGDEIDRMGIFDIFTQRLSENISEITIPPAREVLCGNDTREKLNKIISDKQKSAKNQAVISALGSELAALDGGLELNFADKYISVVYPEKECFLDYVRHDNPLVIIRETNAVNDKLTASNWNAEQNVTELISSGTISGKYAEYYRAADEFEDFVSLSRVVHVNAFMSGITESKNGGLFGFSTKQTVSYAGNYSLLCEDLEHYTKSHFKIILTCDGEAEAKNILSMLLEKGYNAIISDSKTEERYSAETLPDSCIIIQKSSLIPGFELPTQKFAILSTSVEFQTGRKRKYLNLSKKSSRKKTEQKILSYADLEEGDFVVHAAYGIGQYMGIEQLTVNGITRDYINIRYAGSDKLFLPVNQLDLVSKYIGAHSDDGTVKLSKFGGSDWGKAKSRAKAAVKDMAKELIKLYAERMRKEGFAFPADDDCQRDFELSFEYDETDGQLDAVADIKQDMMNSFPMDRLLCGDVGYGKTEVALRAAFKAVLAGKQVAILVPTTILAMQHYQTALRRMRGFPVTVDMVSRFRTPKQQAEILRRLRRGEIDIIIGTHRLVSSDVKFKDLGLLVIDEEQRFGVAQKEKLKQISGNVDVLTLSATPIPRTLNMAMGGIRDISILDEAPGDRLPVQTYVLENDEIIINEAIRKELRRGGQIFYMHNNVESIDVTAFRLSQVFPDAKIATAHGKMDKEQLEDIWQSLITGETDILVCTTIIETGVDVPNANTLIVENADRLGLSQLHQIRGRVGRSSRKAYAYFTYPKGKALSEIATKRLSAIREYAEFGAGFKIALRDLEIRGAGNILGAEQHGHMDSVGYDMYIKLLNEAVLEEKGEKPKEKVECVVDVDLDAYIPEKYINSSVGRMDMYKKIAHIENELDFADIQDELIDRFGDIPQSALNLLKISLIRSYGIKCDIKKIEYRGNGIRIIPQRIDLETWSQVTSEFENRIRIVMSSSPYLEIRLKKFDFPLNVLKEVLGRFIEIVESDKK